MRQRGKAGVQLPLQATEGYGKVATPWSFASEPPLSKGDIESALSTFRDTAQKAMRELADQQKKKDEREAAAQKKTPASGSTASTPDPATPKNNTGAASGTSTAAEPMPSTTYWILIGISALAVTGIAWYFVRRKLFSHDIEQRYALYLSTLSYQQLRAKHGGDLELANAELDEHLRFIRGDLDNGSTLAKEVLDEKKKPTPFFDSVLGLPVPIAVQHDPVFVQYLKHNDTFV